MRTGLALCTPAGLGLSALSTVCALADDCPDRTMLDMVSVALAGCRIDGSSTCLLLEPAGSAFSHHTCQNAGMQCHRGVSHKAYAQLMLMIWLGHV